MAITSRLELWQCNPLTGIFEDDFDAHADLHSFDGAADDIAAKSRSFVEIDPGGDVRDIGGKASERVSDDLTDDREGKDLAGSTHLHPFQFVAVALDANRPGTKHPGNSAIPGTQY
jgi:hypothetical protein